MEVNLIGNTVLNPIHACIMTAGFTVPIKLSLPTEVVVEWVVFFCWFFFFWGGGEEFGVLFVGFLVVVLKKSKSKFHTHPDSILIDWSSHI